MRKRVFDIIKDIQDPEKPFTLEELGIISEDSIVITENNSKSYSEIVITWKPTVKNCKLALNIGLAIRYRLSIYFRERNTKIDLFIKKGYHRQEEEINKQLNDKERYLAAFENPDILNFLGENYSVVS